jgi:NADH-quinone oxidoreductase subunit J
VTVLFYIAAAIAVIATGMVITRTKPVHALLYLVVSFLALAVVFYTLGAPFIAALEVIIYAGAIMVLFLFALMLIDPGRADEARERAWMRPRTWIIPSVFVAVLLFEVIYLLARGGVPGGAAAGGAAHGAAGGAAGAAAAAAQVKAVGISLFGPYLLGVELASILLLAGLVAAHRLTQHLDEERDDGPEAPEAGVGRAGAALPGERP